MQEGGGAYLKPYVHNNFPNFTIIRIAKTEEEIGFVFPFYKCDDIQVYTLTQRY